MSIPPILELQAEDVKLMLAAKCHLGSQNINAKMKKYIFTQRGDGIHIIRLDLLWEKLVLAARAIVTVQNPKDVCVSSFCVNGRRSALKFGEYVGASTLIGRYLPGTLTNPTVIGYTEPLLLIVTDPIADAQIINESRYCNIPVIALANSHSSLKNVDIAIPCNNVSRYSIGVITWLLARTVLRLRGWLKYDSVWDVKVDMFFYLEEKEEETEEYTPKNDDWNKNKPTWTKDTWKDDFAMTETAGNLSDKVIWTSEADNNPPSSWMAEATGTGTGESFDFNSMFGQTAGNDFNWADDTDPIIEASGGGWDSSPKQSNTASGSGWDSSTKQGNTASASEWSSSAPKETNLPEMSGWDAPTSSAPQGGSTISTGGWNEPAFDGWN